MLTTILLSEACGRVEQEHDGSPQAVVTHGYNRRGSEMIHTS